MGVVDEGRMKKEASDLFRKLGITVNMTQPMKKMSVSQRQMCEIAKAISYNSKVIVLDEPTSSLTAPEVEKLFKMMRQLKEQGISLIYISHKMDEIFEICDQISVLRDGSLVMTKDSKDTDMNELISAMVGRSLDNRFPPVDNKPGEVIFSVENLSTKYAPKLQNISFDIRKGEIFGLYGLVGAGRTELLDPGPGLIAVFVRQMSLLVPVPGVDPIEHSLQKARPGGFPALIGSLDQIEARGELQPLLRQPAEGGCHPFDPHGATSSPFSRAARPKRTACWRISFSGSARHRAAIRRRNSPVRVSSSIRSHTARCTRVRSRRVRP